jgi:pimeloyl-ACP methyl ester carboxylesterase
VFESRSHSGRLARAGAIVVFIMLAGATYQGVATALERREFPRLGGLVSIGDHQLHLYCVGSGVPAVVLEAPAAGLSAAWSEVQGRLAGRTRVCSYDRSGLGWSEAGDRPFDPGRVPEELRTLLEASKEPGPFVVVGHGLGAAFAQMYAARPDAHAAAVVLINPPAGDAGHAPKATWLMPASPWLARVGVLRVGRILSSKADALDGSSGAAVRAFLNRPDHLTRAAAEVAKWDDAVRLAAGRPLGAEVPTKTVRVSDNDRIAFLSDPADIERVVAAIDEAITTSRERSAAP